MKKTIKFLFKSLLYAYLIFFIITFIDNITPRHQCEVTLENYSDCVVLPFDYTSNDLLLYVKKFQKNHHLLKNVENQQVLKFLESYSNYTIDQFNFQPVIEDEIFNNLLEEYIQNKQFIYLTLYFKSKQNKWSDQMILEKSIDYIMQLRQKNACTVFRGEFYKYYQNFTNQNHYDNVFLEEENKCKK